MSDIIDYDEIDKAVLEAQAQARSKQKQAELQAERTASKKAAAKISVAQTPKPNPATAPQATRHPRFMDVARPQASAHKISVAPTCQNTKPQTNISATKAAQIKLAEAQHLAALKAQQEQHEQAKLRAAELHAKQVAARKQAAKLQAERAAAIKKSNQNPSTANMPRYHSAPMQNTAVPSVNQELRRQQLIAHKKQQQKLAQEKRDAAELRQLYAESEIDAIFDDFDDLDNKNPLVDARDNANIETKDKLSHSAAAAKATLEGNHHSKDAPNANNYSLGVRSPFIVNTNVEKRPLGNVYNANDNIESSKNSYSQKDPSKAKSKKLDKHTVIETEPRKSGWVWTVIALFIIASGGALGYIAYLLVFTNGS